MVTEFFAGAVEIGEAGIDDAIIDQGLLLIRKLWDAGIAHRDIKPGNLMVRPGELLLIDVAFAQVRPSPWRQAVDLGNMMLVLGLRSSPQRVYHRHADGGLRYLRRPPNPLRPAPDAEVRACGQPGPRILRRSPLHLPRLSTQPT